MEQKKIYETPKMSVLLIKNQAPLMQSSGYSGEGAYIDNENDPIV